MSNLPLPEITVDEFIVRREQEGLAAVQYGGWVFWSNDDRTGLLCAPVNINDTVDVDNITVPEAMSVRAQAALLEALLLIGAEQYRY